MSDRETFWNIPLGALQAELSTGADGLTHAQAQQRLQRFGPNRLPVHPPRALALQFLARFGNPLIIVLLVASAIAALSGDVASFAIIGIIVVLSVTPDFAQEYHAQRVAQGLRQSVAARARVLRDGKPGEIPTTELVPGDVVFLSAGDLVPADGRLLDAKDFFVNQALLTGEPYPVEKRAGDLPTPADDITAHPATKSIDANNCIRVRFISLLLGLKSPKRTDRARSPQRRARDPASSVFGVLAGRATSAVFRVAFTPLVGCDSSRVSISRSAVSQSSTGSPF